MKHNQLALVIALCAVAVIVFMVMIQKKSEREIATPQSALSTTDVAVVVQEDSPAINAQPEPPLPFNGEDASITGTVKSITGNRLVIEVVEQPKDQSGLVTKTYQIQISNQTIYTLIATQTGGAMEPATRSDMGVGDYLEVVVSQPTDLQADPIIAQRIEIHSSR